MIDALRQAQASTWSTWAGCVQGKTGCLPAGAFLADAVWIAPGM
jgi:hypothetical protein